MLAFARKQLNDDHVAEDVVQDAFLAALAQADRFRGEAALKTWVFAILKNKILDALRTRYRQQAREAVLPDENEESLDECFKSNGHWDKDNAPAALGQPERHVYNQQFWQLLQVCLDNLPGLQGQVFMMREYLEMTGSEICQQTQLSQNNMNVMLYRARLRLQKCLHIQGVGAT